MITEDYVSFDTAKLLKEKGFNEYTAMVYNQNGSFMPNGAIEDTYQTFYSAPTLQMAMKWLREVYKQSINLWYDGDIWSSEIYRAVEKEFCLVGHFQSYEEACEAAIKYCLENLI